MSDHGPYSDWYAALFHASGRPLWFEPAGCTFIPMATTSLFLEFCRSYKQIQLRTPGSVPPVPLVLLAVMGLTASAWARPAKDVVTATLVETAAYTPCRDGCSAMTDPARAFCFRVGGEFLVGEGRSFFHEENLTSMEDLVGKQVQIRVKSHTVWITPLDRPAVKILRGSLYEDFKDNGCVRKVHGPILALALRKRPHGKFPGDAIAIAGPDRGEFQPLYVWYQCALDGDAIACRRWYRNGAPASGDWYCARSMDGVRVGAGFAIDPELSRVGRLVLASGAVLLQDARERIDGKLEKPGEACF
ncbi:MAG: hypothetical protein ABSG51_14680 [Terracidiphilus sp.]|jgi:hypothetical protein